MTTTRSAALSRQVTLSYQRGDTSTPLVLQTIVDALREAVAADPDRIAVIEGTPGRGLRRRLTSAELLDRSERAARALLTRFRVGERVALWAGNSLEWIVVAYGAALAGIVLVPVNPAYRAAELGYVLRVSRSVGLIRAASPASAATVVAARANVTDLREVLLLDELADADAQAASVALPAVAPDTEAHLHFTSGTTGAPKGVLLRHGAMVANARLAWERLGVAAGGADEVAVWPTPLFKPAGCGLGMLGALTAGATFVCAPAVDPALYLELLDTCRATVTFAAPALLAELLEHADQTRHDLTTLRLVGTEGSSVPVGLVDHVERRFGVPVVVAFSATECSPVVTAPRSDTQQDVRAATAGSALPHTEVMIADPERGNPVLVGAVGELCIRGYLVMKGYLDDPEGTAAVIDGDGWYHTRDLATMDDAGNIRVEGRITDVIVRGGEHILPREIENVLQTHPAVAEVAVVGRPDERWGETVAAFVRPAPGTAPTEVELHSWCRRWLANHKTPLRWLFVDAMPLTAAGTIRRNVLRARLRA